jgi:DNA-binding NtrC family response regulator
VISATNADLLALIADGRFREDLYYRVNVIELKVPGLAERRDDVLSLAGHFLAPGCRLDPSAERALMRHSWPGNVRELANAIQRACLLARGDVIAVEHLALAAPAATALRMEREPDRSEIEVALHRAEGVVARAARHLGLSRQALYRRMEKLGMKG